MGSSDEVVALDADVLGQYAAFTRFNSPYPAHDAGHAIDLYPTAGAPSPVAGTVRLTRTLRAPTKPYAAEHDHLIVVDTGAHLARILHVDPSVDPGDVVDVGDPLGETVRSGYFAPWVDDHLHLGFRPPDADPVRASGSLPVRAEVAVEAVPWDGSGTVVERAETFVVLDAPGHPAPGEHFAAIAADGRPEDGDDGRGRGADPTHPTRWLDGGLPHYEGGGLVSAARGSSPGGGGSDDPGAGTVWLAGSPVGRASGEIVTWDDVTVLANGQPVTGLSLACYRDRLGTKLVSWAGVLADVGERVAVEIRRA